MPNQIASRPKHGEALGTAQDDGQVFPTDSRNLFDDDVEFALNSILGDGLKFPFYEKSEVPDALDNPNSVIFVTDAPGGTTPAFSRGAVWLSFVTGLQIAP